MATASRTLSINILGAAPMGTAQVLVTQSALFVNQGQSVTITYSSTGAVALDLLMPSGSVPLDPSPGSHVYTFTPEESGPFPARAVDAAGGAVIRPLSIIVKKTRTAISPTAPVTKQSAQNGTWDDPATWGGSVPTVDDVVFIVHTVTFSGRENYAGRILLGGGTLRTNPLLGGVLYTTDLDVPLGSTLELGPAGSPIAVGKKALIVLLNRPTHASDAAKFWPAVCIRGTFICNGQPATRGLRLAGDANAGATYLDFVSAPVGWKAGQKLWLADTRQVRDNGSRGELLLVRGVQGTRVYLLDPLVYTHPFVRRPSSAAAAYRPHVLNLSGENVGIVTEDPTTTATRAHIVIESTATLDLHFPVIHATGRTLNGSFTATNLNDRLPLRLEGLSDFTIEGMVCLEPLPVVTATPTSVRWGVTVSDCTGGTIKDCVSFNWAAEGFACRGSTGVVFQDCWASRIKGDGNRGDTGQSDGTLGREGSGFWCNRASNTWLRCHASECDMYGQIFFTHQDYWTEPITRHEDCEYYACAMTFTVWLLGAAYTAYNASQAESVVKRMVCWHPRTRAYFAYPTNRLTFDGCIWLGDPPLMKANNTYSIGYGPSDYLQVDALFVNGEISGFKWAMYAPIKPGTSSQPPADGYADWTVKDSHLHNWMNLVLEVQGAVTGGGESLTGRRITCDGVTYGPQTADMPGPPVEWQLDWIFRSNPNAVEPDKFEVLNRGGVAGQNFHLYRNEQAASFVIPQAGIPASLSYLAGLTNQQAQDQYGKSICGEIMPAAATVASWTNGRIV